jgi:general secretion pathway protein A
MYKNFFGLKENPFDANPNPRYLFLTEQVEQALGGLMHGIEARRGFITLTGEAGTGKTTLVNLSLGLLRQRRTRTAFLFNSSMNSNQLLGSILVAFGIACHTRDKSQQLQKLNRWLLERYRAGENAALFVDEAQNLSHTVLEDIRMLTNLETPSERLLQIVLSGQPELEEKLKLPQLRQLRQRVMLRCKTHRLTKEQTVGYIAERLRIAGATGDPIFSAKAMDTVHMHSLGVARIINLLCEHSLVGAFADGRRLIEAEIVERVATEFQLDKTELTPPDVALNIEVELDDSTFLVQDLGEVLKEIQSSSALTDNQSRRK